MKAPKDMLPPDEDEPVVEAFYKRELEHVDPVGSDSPQDKLADEAVDVFARDALRERVHAKIVEALNPSPPEVGPLDLSQVSPAMLLALSKAQGEVETVGRDARNDQRGYKYASADAMMRGSREPLAANGLAFFSTWTRVPIVAPGGDIGNQFVVANVRLHFALTWSNGKESAMIRGTAELDAIGSRARPPDKAVAATLTYMRGFVLRELLNIDRGGDGDDVDQRDDSVPYQPRDNGGRGQARQPDPPRATSRTVTPAGDKARESSELEELRKSVHGLVVHLNDSTGQTWAEVAQALGLKNPKAPTADDLREAYAWITLRLAKVAHEEGEGHLPEDEDQRPRCPACGLADGRHEAGCPEADEVPHDPETGEVLEQPKPTTSGSEDGPQEP